MISQSLRKLCCWGFACALLLAGRTAVAEVSQLPLYLTSSATPLMMLTMSRDEQLFNKAYPDYTDLDNDGRLDTTYQDAFDYSGYFDSNRCYDYSTTNNRFKSVAVATDINGNGKAHECGAASSGRWSGNFLNWVTMSRIDVLRYVLYGGYRSTDTAQSGSTAGITVLERAHIPNDLHAWAKVYSGADVASFTPYATTTSFCNASFGTSTEPRLRIAQGSYPEWASTALQQCLWADNVFPQYTVASYCPTNYGNVIPSGTNAGKCRVTNYQGYNNVDNNASTQCNGNSPTTNPIAKCANQTTKTINTCETAPGNSSCYDDPPTSAQLLGGTDGAVVRVEVCDPNAPSTREAFCRQYGNNSKPAGVLQEYGEPKDTASEGRVRFGLVSGSYSNPRSGGILRRNIGKLTNNPGDKNRSGFEAGCAPADEISLTTGQFCTTPTTSAGTDSLIRTIDRFKIANNLATWNGNWSDCGTYSINNRSGGNGHLNNPGSSTSEIIYKSDGSVDKTLPAYKCSAWGNPIAEMYGETLRYLSGLAKTDSFSQGTDLTNLSAPGWLDPYSTANTFGGVPYCSKCNILVISSGSSSFDGDEVPAIPAFSLGVDAATKAVGDIEGVTGQYLIGRSLNHLRTGQTGTLGVREAANTHEDLCQATLVDDMSKAVGLCPDTPAQEGTFKIGGLAFQAHTQDLRPTGVANKPAQYKVTASTYGVALAESLPKFEIPVGAGKITLAPLCQANNDGNATATSSDWRSCFLGSVSVGPKTSVAKSASTATATNRYTYGRLLEADNTAGSFSFVWEDSQWGNDHDNDVVTMITYCVGSKCEAKTGTRNGTSGSLTATYNGYDICWRSNSTVCGTAGTPAVAADEVLVRVENLSAYAGNAMLTGFSVSGAGAAATGNDGDGLKRIALRPGNSDNSILTQAENPPSGWARPQVLKLKVGTSAVKQFQNPLWYAAKYGGFNIDSNTTESNPNPVNQGDDSWGTLANGVRVPNNFFQIRDPAKLKTALKTVFQRVAEDVDSSASAVASNSTRVDTDTLIYQAQFNTKDWTGEVIAYELRDDGGLGQVAWKTSTMTRPARTNTVFTWNDETNAGAPFSWNSISPAQQALLMHGGSVVDGTTRMTWVLNSTDTSGGTYRSRPSWIGDIVNSDPFYLGVSDSGYDGLPGTTDGKSSYLEFRGTTASRTKTLFFGANDGMLHALNGLTGQELFAYVPAGLYATLPQLMTTNYDHRYYVDGDPTVGDAYFALGSANAAWHSVLIGTTAAGGSSVFALDVTDPTAFSADKVLWEITPKTRCSSDPADTTQPGCFADLGYTFGKGTVGRMQDGTWVAIFANGYESATRKAVLYIVNVATGVLIKKIETCGSTDSSCLAGYNGLSSPTVIFDSNRTIIAAYAGDLKGNLWKFDLSSKSASEWVVAYDAPLFTAVNGDDIPQSITAPLEVGFNSVGGYMIYFGTGKYYEVGDNAVGSSPAVQSFYGVWDNGSTISGRSVLQQQTILAEVGLGTVITDASVAAKQPFNSLRGVSNATFTYSATKRGWYIDLVSPANGAEGERVVNQAKLRSGNITFTTMIPLGDACTGGGRSWAMELDALSGGRTTSAVFDINGDGQFSTTDYLQLPNGSFIPASGLGFSGIISRPTRVGGKNYFNNTLMGNAAGPGGGGGGGGPNHYDSNFPNGRRQSWQQVH